MTTPATQAVRDLDAYCARLEAAGLDAPWSRPGPLIPPKPTATQACLWRWREIEPLLRESSEHLSLHRGAERRVLRLRNPGVPERTAAHSLVVALQYLLPGEVAPAHRHSPSAIRFMLRGEGAYTTVDGQRCPMQPGDLVVTPSMAWHDHGNSGGQPTMWMDMLDWQVVRFLEKPDLRGLPRRSADGDSQSRRRPVAPLVAGSHAEPDPFDDLRSSTAGRRVSTTGSEAGIHQGHLRAAELPTHGQRAYERLIHFGGLKVERLGGGPNLVG